MTQDKVSKYKRVVMFLIGIVILGANTAIFGYVWYQFYSDAILLPFYRRGNWLVVGVYLVIYFLFSKIYGGLKVGNARISDIIYSQTLALLFTNAVTYAQISLIARWFCGRAGRTGYISMYFPPGRCFWFTAAIPLPVWR